MMMEILLQYCTLENLFILIPTLLATAGILLSVLSFVTPWNKRKRHEWLIDRDVFNPAAGDVNKFVPLIKSNANERPAFEPSSLYVSIVVPAMNEEQRIGVMLDETIDYCEKRAAKDKDFTYEIIIVDDGSKDQTATVGARYGSKYPGRVFVMKLAVNIGKGGAVREGVLYSRGKLILFVDADGATKFEDFEKLEQSLIRASGGPPVDETFPGIAIGSRAHLEEQAKAERSFSRNFLMHGFHFLVWIFAVRTVRDTQCGFKLFTRAAAAKIFPILHVEKWAFDVELIFLCEKWKYSISEVAVRWHEVEGSKITPIWSWLQMGRDLVLIWFRYQVGIWTDRVRE